jgi:hypothetical protein
MTEPEVVVGVSRDVESLGILELCRTPVPGME